MVAMVVGAKPTAEPGTALVVWSTAAGTVVVAVPRSGAIAVVVVTTTSGVSVVTIDIAVKIQLTTVCDFNKTGAFNVSTYDSM